MPRPIWRTILLATVSLGAVLGNWNDTSTGIDLDKLPHFPLAKIHSGWLKDGSRITFDGITATDANPEAREVRLRAVGKSGKRWEAHLCCLDEVWRGDLDGNGTQDYVFFSAGPYYNGRTTPSFSLSILLMDREGMPVPFFTVVYRGENGDGVKHLVDLNHDGRAQLLISSYDENVSDPQVGPFCSGHWVNQLYRFVDFGAEEIRETVGGISFPFIHDWSYGTTVCDDPFPPSMRVQPATVYEHGTSARGEMATTIRGPKDGVSPVAIEPVGGCKTIIPAIVVYEHANVREIGFPSLFSTYPSDLIDAIWRADARVKLRGINRWMGNGDCSVNLVWAK